MKVLLGMSGGTDSSVAAMMLLQEGFEVIGVTFRFLDSTESTQNISDAKQLADSLGIQHVVYDAVELFRTTVIDYFISEYFLGRTPVPCTICNVELKWKLLHDLAIEMGCDKIATGHYAQIEQYKNTFFIKKGIDEEKDQSFFLWGLSQTILSKMILPLGKYTKSEIRKLAQRFGYQHIANKKDSVGLCFCKGDYRDFLKKECGENCVEKGNFIDEAGRFLGKHEGYPFYTVGQRRGLIFLNRAVYVKEIRKDSNQVVLAPQSSLFKDSFFIEKSNFFSCEKLNSAKNLIVKIRYRKQATPCKLTFLDEKQDEIKVQLLEPLESISAGQAAAFYDEDLLLGGGIIL